MLSMDLEVGVVDDTSLYLFFFFFQAEDGIRDIGVTGVQTCALPIYPSRECSRRRADRANRPCCRKGGRAPVGSPCRASRAAKNRFGLLRGHGDERGAWRPLLVAHQHEPARAARLHGWRVVSVRVASGA